MKRKVFSRKAWMKDRGYTEEQAEIYRFARECDGKTVEECEALGYAFTDYSKEKLFIAEEPDKFIAEEPDKFIAEEPDKFIAEEPDKFKPIAWNDSHDYETRIVNSSFVRVAFGIELDVMRKHDKWHWSMGTGYDIFKKGSCASVEKAKRNAEKAFQEYVQANLALCMEE